MPLQGDSSKATMNTMHFNSGAARRAPAPAGAAADLYPRAGLGEDDGAPLLEQVVSIARRRKWVIIGSTILVLLLGILATLLMTPKYTAASTIEIQREGSSFVNVEGAEPKSGSGDQEFYQTQYGLLRSQSLAERVAQNLRLYDDAHFFEVSGGPETWFANGRVVPGASTHEDRIRAAGGILLSKFVVQSERQSRLVQLRYTNPDPAIAKRVVDAWAVAFIQTTLTRRYEATSYARRFLEQRLAQLRQRIDASERQLVVYARQQGIVNIPAPASAAGAPGGGERPLVADNLSTLNAELGQATADRVRAESRLNTPGGDAVETLQNSAISAMRQQRTQFAADYAKMMVQFEPDYPPARAIKIQIDQLDRALAREETRIVDTLRKTFDASVKREQTLRGQVSTLKGDVLDFRQRSIQYNIIQRDADTNRQLYDALLQRYKEIGVAGGIGVNNISVVDDAETPTVPSSPNLFLNIALSLLAGIGLGIGAAILLEQIDQGVSDPKDVEQELGLPLLGTIPRSEVDDVVAALQDRKSVLYEAYLSVRTNLAFTTDHGLPRTVAVTSTRASEGKSTTSYALARSFARGNHRVLLLDADMRSPSVHLELGIANDVGLSNYLAGGDELASLVKATGIDNLSVMTAGPHPPSAPELLSSDRLPMLLTELLKSFDHVILDAPPVMGLADAPIIGGQVEGVIFVAESHATQKAMMRVALERLASANVNVLGAVLTKFDTKRAHYGYGYSYGYGYGYGSQEQA